MHLVLLILNGKITKTADLILGQIIIDVQEIGFKDKNIKKGVPTTPVMIIINGKTTKIVLIQAKFAKTGNAYWDVKMNVPILAKKDVLTQDIIKFVGIMTMILAWNGPVLIVAAQMLVQDQLGEIIIVQDGEYVHIQTQIVLLTVILVETKHVIQNVEKVPQTVQRIAVIQN